MLPAAKTEKSKETSFRGGFDDKATYSYYNAGNGGRMAWRINKKGTAFGKTIKLVFSNGYTVIIPNTSQKFAKSDGLIYRTGYRLNRKRHRDIPRRDLSVRTVWQQKQKRYYLVLRFF